MTEVEMKQLTDKIGDAFYMLESKQFRQNFMELKSEFTNIYPNFNIAYSYKTNYTPKLCRIVNELGGFAEVVSDMEMEIALRIGVEPKNIIWNGPFKNAKKVEQLIVMGGTVNIDSAYEIDLIAEIAKKYPNHKLNIGIRCNFDVNDGVVSRFGFDIESEDFNRAIALFGEYKNLYLIGIDEFKKQGIWLDIKIIAGTAAKVFKKQDIYEEKSDASMDDAEAAKFAEEEIIRIAHLPDDEVTEKVEVTN